MSRQMTANSATVPVFAGSASAVGQNSAISSYVTRPWMNAPILPSSSLKCWCSSSSTKCQSMSWSGPSKNPSRETEMDRMSLRIGGLADRLGYAARRAEHGYRVRVRVARNVTRAGPPGP